MYNFIIGTISILIGIVSGLIFVSIYLFILGSTVPIEQQTGLLLTVLSASIGLVAAMIMFVVGHLFYDKFSRDWWQ